MANEKIPANQTCPSCKTTGSLPQAGSENAFVCEACGYSAKSKSAENKTYPVIGKLALDNKLISEIQLEEALEIQRKYHAEGKKIPLEDIFLEKRMISAPTIKKLKVATTRKLDNQFGQLAIKKGFVSKEQVENALAVQAKTYKDYGSCQLIGDILITSGALKEDQQAEIMQQQKRVEKKLTKITRVDEPHAPRVESELLYPTLGDVALNNKIIKGEQLQEAKQLLKVERKQRDVDLADVLLERKMVTVPMMAKLKTATTRLLDKEFGALAVKKEFVNQETVDRVLREQAMEFKSSKTCKIIGDMLVAQQVMTEEQCLKILIEQKRLKVDNTHVKELSKKDLQTPSSGEENSAIQPDVAVADNKKSEMTVSEKVFWKMRRIDKAFCEIAIKNSFITEAESIDALEFQVQEFERLKLRRKISDILTDKGYLSRERCDWILAQQGRLTEDTSQDASEKDFIEEIEFDKHDQIRLTVKADQLSAYIRAVQNKLSQAVTVQNIKDALKDRGIVVGVIADNKISEFLEKEGEAQKKDIMIAAGKKAVAGRDAKIKYFFDVDYLKVGALTDAGDIDFKDRGEIPFVKEGTLLAEKIPLIKGEPGMDIYGKPLREETEKDFKLKCETGVVTSDDGLKAYAEYDGQPKVSLGGKLMVLSELKINGDIGFETGHVDFNGNVTVKGTVQTGFKVRSAQLNVKEINGGDIDASGDIHVDGGITGAKIKTLGNVYAKYMKKSTVMAYGDVIVEKEVIESKVVNSGAFILRRGKLITSEVASRRGIEAAEIGTDISDPCHLRVGVEEHIEKEVESFDASIAKEKELLEMLDLEHKTMEEEDQRIHVKIAELAQIQDRSIVGQREIKKRMEEGKRAGDAKQIKEAEFQLKELDEQAKKADEDINELFEKQDKLNQRMLDTGQRMKDVQENLESIIEEKKAFIVHMRKEKGAASVKVLKILHEGTHISGIQSSIISDKNMKRVEIREIKLPESNGNHGWEMKVLPLR